MPGGLGALQRLQKELGNLDFPGSKRNLGKANFKRSLHECVSVVVVFFFDQRYHFPFKTKRGKAS